VADDIEMKPVSVMGGCALFYRMAGERYWRKLDDEKGRTKFFPSAVLAMSAGRRTFGIKDKREMLSAKPTPPQMTPEQREFYDRKAGEMSVTNHLVKRRPVVEVVDGKGRTLRKIGDLI
jgi:hypothetical protein